MHRFSTLPVRTLLCAVLASGACFAQAIRSDAGCRAQSIARNDDGSSGLVNLGFTVNLFGKTRSAIYVNNNGNMTFDAALTSYTPSPISSIRREMIAPFWGDVDTRPVLSNLVTYGTMTVDGRRAFCANYVNVAFYDYGDRLNSFQAVLIDRTDTGVGNFDIEFNYERILWETGEASGGNANGLGGRSAGVGYTNGTLAPDTAFELPGSGIPGALLDSSVNGLVRRSLNTSIPGRLLFAVRNGALRQSLTASPVSLLFRAPGTAPVAPAAQTVALAASSGQISYNVVRVTTADGTNWLTAAPLGSGVTPGVVTVRANPAGLARGSYTGEIFVQPPDVTIPPVTIPVTFLVGDQVPFTVRNGVTNGASYITGVVVPGSIFSIFGENLAPSTEATSVIPLPVTRAGVSVLINGVRIPLFLVSQQQINGQIPLNLPLGTATIRIEANGSASPPVAVDVASALPGIFTYANSARGVIQNQDFALNASSNPARIGTAIVAYLTGIGAVDNPVAAGTPAPDSPLSRAVARFTATIAGRDAPVLFTGYTPRTVGLAQINIRIPTGVPSGEQQLVIYANDIPSAPVSVFVAQ